MFVGDPSLKLGITRKRTIPYLTYIPVVVLGRSLRPCGVWCLLRRHSRPIRFKLKMNRRSTDAGDDVLEEARKRIFDGSQRLSERLSSSLAAREL